MATAEIRGRLSLDNNPFTQALRQSEAAATKTGKTISDVFSSLASPLAAIGPAIAAAFAGNAIAGGVKSVFDMAEGLGDISDQTGISVGRLSMLSKAFKNAGLEAEDVGSMVNRMQRFLVEASETGKGNSILDGLGLSALALRRLAPEQQMQTLGKAIGNIRDPAERSNAAMEVFSKSGGRLLAAFNDPAFAKAGGAITGNAAILEQNADLFSQASIKLNQAGAMFRTFYLGVASVVAGPLVAVLDEVNKVDLVSVGQQFGIGLIAGATSFVQMLNAVKSSGFVPGAKAVAVALQWGGKELADFAERAGRTWHEGVEDARKLGTLAQIAGGTFVAAGVAFGEITGGVVDVLRGKLMQAPLGMIAVALAGFNFLTDTLPGKLMDGFRQASEYLQGLFGYVAEHFTTEFGKQLLGVATKFATAITNPVAAASMLAAALAGPAGASLQQHVDRARGQFGGGSGEATGSFGDYLSAAKNNVMTSAKGLYNEGQTLVDKGSVEVKAAIEKLQQVTKDGSRDFVDALRSQPLAVVSNPPTATPSSAPTETNPKNPPKEDKPKPTLRPTGGLETGHLTSGGLTGPGSDTAEDARQKLAHIREEVKWQDPDLKGPDLERAVAERKAQMDKQDRINEYRRTHTDPNQPLGPANKPENKEVSLSMSATKSLAAEFKTAVAELMAK